MYYFLKRIIDIFLSFVLLILFLPVILITALVIRLTSKGPIFADTPMRVGKEGRLFYPYKFRSMVANAHELLRTDPKFKKLFEEYKKSSYKLLEDPRVTPVGKIIRKHSIDEVPQFLNVLKGEMSIVGPSPYYPDELKEQQMKYPQTSKMVEEDLTVKPGITGFWQLTGRSVVNFVM